MNVLVVDDQLFEIEPYLDELLARGHSVDTASNAEDCMAKLGESEQVDVLVLDIMMPSSTLDFHESNGGLSTGLLLLQKIREIRPSLPICLLSNKNPNASEFAEDEHTAWLMKLDVTPADLAGHVETVGAQA